MPEPMIQVPVSLIEATIEVADEQGLGSLASEYRALLSQPGPSTEPDIDVCLYCHGAGYHDGGEMRDDEPCHACNQTGLADPFNIEGMAIGTTFTASLMFGREGCRFERSNGSSPVRLLPSRIGYWIDDVDPSTIRDVTPPKATDG